MSDPYNNKSYKTVTTETNKLARIKFQNDTLEIKNLKDILFYLLYKNSATVYVESGKLQCESGRSRTAEDAYLLNLHYLKKPFSFEYVDKLIQRYRNYPTMPLSRSLCSTVKRNVHRTSNSTLTKEKFYEIIQKQTGGKPKKIDAESKYAEIEKE